MVVIAKKGTTKIIKGHRYEVHSLYNAPGGSRYNRGRVHIKGIGSYVVANFTTTDGNELPKIDWQSHVVIAQEKSISFEELKINDIIVCNSDRYTTLMKGSKYRIVDLKATSVQKAGYQGRTYTQTTKKVKFEGCNRYFEFSPWKFRRLNVDESRSLHLGTLLDNEEHSYSVDVVNRKIDLIDNKNAALIKALAKSIIDNYRHELGVVDWACQKTASRLKITKDDYDKLLKMPLKDILKIVETK